MYPIDVFPTWFTLIAVVAFGALGYWVADKDNSARPFGLTALPIAMIAGWCWFTGLPEWTAWTTALAAFLLFIAGMFRSEDKDDLWHYGAVLVALFGKLLFWTATALWPVLTGQVSVPVWLLAALISMIVIGFASWRSERVRGWGHWLTDRLRKGPEAQPTT